MLCPNCGAENDEQAKECILCGCKFVNEQENNIENPVPETPVAKTEKQKSSKVPLIVLSIVCVVLALIAVFLIFGLVNNNKNSDNKQAGVNSSAVSAAENTTTTSTTTGTSPTTTTTTEPTTTTTTTTTTAATTKKTTTTTAKPEVYAKNLTNVTKGELISQYFNSIYDVDTASIGQQNVVALKNTGKFPYYKFGFMYMEASEIPDSDTVCTVQVLPGGKIDDKATIGMTYNELKDIYHFDGAKLDGGTFGMTAWVNIDGQKWGIEFALTTEDKAKLGILNGVSFEDIGKVYDLSEINPKSDLGYYIDSLQ
ncbi:MAG: hypothetical protein ACI4RN_08055 [Oscillospiraceae bacterium]